MDEFPNAWTPKLTLEEQNYNFARHYPRDEWDPLLRRLRVAHYDEVGFRTPSKQRDHFEKHKDEFPDVPDSALYTLKAIWVVQQAFEQPASRAIESYLLLWDYTPESRMYGRLILVYGDTLVRVLLPRNSRRLEIESMYKPSSGTAYYTRNLVALDHPSEAVQPSTLTPVVWRFFYGDPRTYYSSRRERHPWSYPPPKPRPPPSTSSRPPPSTSSQPSSSTSSRPPPSTSSRPSSSTSSQPASSVRSDGTWSRQSSAAPAGKFAYVQRTGVTFGPPKKVGGGEFYFGQIGLYWRYAQTLRPPTFFQKLTQTLMYERLWFDSIELNQRNYIPPGGILNLQTTV